MPVSRTYRCNQCEHMFTFMHHPADEPAFCPFCGYSEERAKMTQTLAMPAIGTHRGKGPDNMYRAMEEGAEFRAQMAQEVHGIDASEAAGLRMTDMRDNLRQGDTSFVPVQNDITRQIDAQPAGGNQMWGFNTGGAQLSPDVRSGPMPNAGLRALSALKANHTQNSIRNNMPSGNGSYSSSLPAYETLAPNYRR